MVTLDAVIMASWTGRHIETDSNWSVTGSMQSVGAVRDIKANLSSMVVFQKEG